MWFGTLELLHPSPPALRRPGGCFFRLAAGLGNGPWLTFERTTSTLRARPTFEPTGVDDVSVSAFRTGLSRPFGVHSKLMVAVEAEVGDVVAFDRLGGDLGVIRVDLASRSRHALEGSGPVDVVRVAVVPGLNAVFAGIALEDLGLSHAGVLPRRASNDSPAPQHPGEDSNFRPAD